MTMKTLLKTLGSQEKLEKARAKARKLLNLFSVEGKPAGEVMTDGQIDIFYTLCFQPADRIQIETCTQFGKLIADDVLVWTTKGWKKHGELRIGDFVFNNKGNAVRVVNILPKFYADREVEFTNGEKIQVNKNHEWLVKHCNWSNWKILETKQIEKYKLIAGKRGSYNFVVPLVKPLKRKEKKLLLNPYFLGAWSGDGSSSKPVITINPKDEDIIKNIPYQVSKKHKHKITGVVAYNFYRTGIIEKLKKQNLFKNKHIPDEYKLSSIQQRLRLLAGIIDTDGYVYRKKRNSGQLDNRVYIINCNKRLIDDICDILFSLGMKPSITKQKPMLSTGGIQGKQMVYTIGFGAKLEIPTKLKRKKIIVDNQKKHISIKSIKRIKPILGNCITVDSKDGIYLVGKKMIPTNAFLPAIYQRQFLPFP